MLIYDRDLALLQAGQPPRNPELLAAMTLGRPIWLDNFQQHYLYNYIADGGSKVKVLVGKEGSGKTHLLRCIGADAANLGYGVVHLSAREFPFRLNDLPNIYRVICQKIDKETLLKGLCRAVAARLGYADRYTGEGKLLPLLVEDGLSRYDAEREIRSAAAKTFRHVDFGPSFVTFAYTLARDGLIAGQGVDAFRSQWKWLLGEKLDKHEQQETGLLEQLKKVTARYWLNSFIKLLKLAGMTGLVVALDDLEVMTERSPETGRLLYSQTAIRDTCEIFRQMIDDVELLNGLLLLLSGRRQIIEDERRGFKSYEALWMRLQTGLVPSARFNPYADIVDVDAHAAALGDDLPRRLSTHLVTVLKQQGFERRYREDLPDLSRYSLLRKAVMENALLVGRKEADYAEVH